MIKFRPLLSVLASLLMTSSAFAGGVIGGSGNPVMLEQEIFNKIMAESIEGRNFEIHGKIFRPTIINLRDGIISLKADDGQDLHLHSNGSMQQNGQEAK